MKIQSALVKNFRKIVLAEINPGKHFVVIAGKNANGKTSLIDGLASALSGKKPPFVKPIHNGADKYEIKIVLDEGIIITQRETAGGTYTLDVKAADGATYSAGQTFLSRFYNAVQFDPLSFMRKEPKKQVEQLKELLGLDFTELDQERRQKEEVRKDAKKEMTRLQGLMSQLPEGLDEAPDEEVSVSSLSEQLRKVEAENFEVQQAKERKARFESNIESANAAIEELKAKIEKIEADKAGFESALQSLVIGEVKPTDNLQSQIATAEDKNRLARLKKERAEKRVEFNKIAKVEHEADERIKAIDADKAKQLASAEFPVPGLSFGEDGVLFNEIPLEECSAAERLKVCLSIGYKMESRMGVMLIRDGSLLDEESISELKVFAEEKDIQVILELVGENHGDEAIIIEDGLVKGQQEVLPV